MHLSPHTPRETEYVATTLAEDGATDEYIGQVLMYHYHDLDEPGGVSVQIARSDIPTKESHQGVVVRERSGNHYPEAFEDAQREFGGSDQVSILPMEED